MTVAMKMTGGYVEWLRENAASLIPEIANSTEAMMYCARLGKFVAYMRARPSTIQAENAEREFAARLASQLTRYAKCLALVLNENEVSHRVLARTTRIAMDTSRGQSLRIVDFLATRSGGAEIKMISLTTGDSSYHTKQMLRFLRKIKVVEVFRPEKLKGIKGQMIWRMTSTFQKLYTTVREKNGDE
jgi:hypothetical protein